MATTGGPHEIDSALVDRALLFHVLDGIDDILNREIGSTGIWSPVGTAKIGMNKGPFLANRPFSHWNASRLTEIPAPCVQTDE